MAPVDVVEFVEIPALGRVSRLCFGCEQLGGVDWGRVNQAEIANSVARAIDHGLNFFDTAGVYGLGDSERLLSRALGHHRRDAIVATKGGLRFERLSGAERATVVRDSSPKAIRNDVHASLERLCLERIPIFLIHWPDPNVPLEDTLQELSRLRDEGKIGVIGLSNFVAANVERTRDTYGIEVVQSPLSLLNAEAQSSFDRCSELGVVTCAYGVLGQGLLAGKYSPDTVFDESDRRHRLSQFSKASMQNAHRLIERLRRVAARLDKSMVQVAIRAVLDHCHASIAIVGVKRSGQLQDILGAMDWKLDRREFNRIIGKNKVQSDKARDDV